MTIPFRLLGVVNVHGLQTGNLIDCFGTHNVNLFQTGIVIVKKHKYCFLKFCFHTC